MHDLGKFMAECVPYHYNTGLITGVSQVGGSRPDVFSCE